MRALVGFGINAHDPISPAHIWRVHQLLPLTLGWLPYVGSLTVPLMLGASLRLGTFAWPILLPPPVFTLKKINPTPSGYSLLFLPRDDKWCHFTSTSFNMGSLWHQGPWSPPQFVFVSLFRNHKIEVFALGQMAILILKSLQKLLKLCRLFRSFSVDIDQFF